MEKAILIVAGVIAFLGVVIGLMYLSMAFNAANLHNQIIDPAPGIQCVVVSAGDSTSVDCWKINEVRI